MLHVCVGYTLVMKNRQKNPVWWTTGSRFGIEILMSRMRKLKGLVTASLRVKTTIPTLVFDLDYE